MGRKKKYTDKAFAHAVRQYFDGISCTEAACRPDGTKILSDAGEPVLLTSYLTPPGITALCLALGIDRTTWHNYAAQDGKKDTCEWARQKIEAFLEHELVTRKKGSLRGVQFSLEHNYGWRERLDVKHTGAVATAELGKAQETLTLEERAEILRTLAKEYCSAEPQGAREEPKSAQEAPKSAAEKPT